MSPKVNGQEYAKQWAAIKILSLSEYTGQLILAPRG